MNTIFEDLVNLCRDRQWWVSTRFIASNFVELLKGLLLAVAFMAPAAVARCSVLDGTQMQQQQL